MSPVSTVWIICGINIGVMLVFFFIVIGIWLLRMHISNCRNRNLNNSNATTQNNAATYSIDDPEIRRTVLMMLFPKKLIPEKQQAQNSTIILNNNDDDDDDLRSKGQQLQQQQDEENLEWYDHKSKQYCTLQAEVDVDDDGKIAIVNELALCSICLEGIEDTVVNGLLCLHTFHRSCILDWFTMEEQYHDDCPMCRQPMWDPEQYMAVVIKQRYQQQQVDNSSRESPTASSAHGFLFHA